MSKCKFCGETLADGTRFCPSCGAKAEEIPVVEAVTEEQSRTNNAQPTGGKRSLNGGMLAWSIVNAVIALCSCCSCAPFASLVLGVIAIIFTAQAQNCLTDEAEKGKLKVAKILNIIATAIIILSVVATIVSVALGIFSSGTYYPPIDIDEFLQRYPAMY